MESASDVRAKPQAAAESAGPCCCFEEIIEKIQRWPKLPPGFWPSSVGLPAAAGKLQADWRRRGTTMGATVGVS
jgi:hypothetical protein